MATAYTYEYYFLTDTSGYKWIHKSPWIHVCIPSGVNAEDQHLYPDTKMYPDTCSRIHFRIQSGVNGPLRSRVRVNASFQMFALTAGENVIGGEGNCPTGKYPGGICPTGKCPGEMPYALFLGACVCKCLTAFVTFP